MDFIGKVIANKYKVIQKIAEGGMSTVWLAESIDNRDKYAIKVLKKDVTSSRVEDIIRFRNEANTVAKLKIPNTARTYEIGEVENENYIVMEYIEGNSLHHILKSGNKYSIEETVNIILKLADILIHIHDVNIIHRDIKPDNIIITQGDKQVKLIDFGLAQVREFNKKDEKEIIGTLYYMAPEQSGAINKSVDERSDLYSLGIIFYQLLVGRLPFYSDNISSVVYQHATKVPEKLIKINPQIPQILEQIVLKLLEKEPEKRYQSAEGLTADLIKYSEGLRDFPLGSNDKIIRLSYRTSLIGREQELKELKDLFNSALQMRGSVCFVGGEAGKGKTRLVNELRSYVCEKEAVFIDGKCFSGDSKVPYSPFKDALNKYIKNFSKYDDNKKEEIRSIVKESIGELGGEVLKLNPLAEEILGKCPALVKLDPVNENKRFQLVISSFFCALAEAEKGLVIMLDDLQWVDNGTMELLGQIINDISKCHLFIVGTYRDNEVENNHKLRQFIYESIEKKYPIKEIQLKFFDSDKMCKFVSTLLYDSEENTKEVSEFILSKSKGNPLFAIEILKQLVNEKVLIRKDNRWILDREKLQKVEISPNIVDTLIKKIKLLNEKEILVMSHAAVIGKKFYNSFLYELMGFDKETAIRIIDKCIEMQFIEEDTLEKGKILFVHDRIKEAFYKNMGEEKRIELHHKIAKILEELNKESIDSIIFELVHHYIESKDCQKILEYAYPAGIKARENYAHEEAVRYFLMVIKILEEQGQGKTGRWIDCLEALGEVYLNIGKYEDAITTFKSVIPFVIDSYRKSYIFRQISDCYYRKSEWSSCELYARKGLELLGEKLPATKLGNVLSIMKELSYLMVRRSLPGLFSTRKVKESQEEKIDSVIRFYRILANAYVLSNLFKAVLLIIRGINLCQDNIRKSRGALITIETGLALLAGSVPWFKFAFKSGEKAVGMSDETNTVLEGAKAIQTLGYCYGWSCQNEKAINAFVKSSRIFKRVGEFKEYLMSLNGMPHAYEALGDFENMKQAIDLLYEGGVRTKDIFSINAATAYYGQYYYQVGEYDKSEYYSRKAHREAEENNNGFSYCGAKLRIAKVLLERGEFKEAIALYEEAKLLNEKNSYLRQYMMSIYYGLVEGHIGEYKNVSHKSSNTDKKKYLKKIAKMCKMAIAKTKAWPMHLGEALTVTAQYYALKGNNIRADEFYLKAIDHNTKHDKRVDIATCQFKYGIFLKDIGRTQDSRRNIEDAYSMFKELGAKGYEKKAAKLLGILDVSDSGRRFSNDMRRAQMMSSMINVGQSISSILDLDVLLEKVMSLAMEATGAQNGYLIIKDDKTGEAKTVVKSHAGMAKNEAISEISSNIVDKVIMSGEPIITANAMEDERFKNFQSVVYSELKSILCIPIKYNNKIIGACYLDNHLTTAVFIEEDMDVLNIIMSQAAISIENAKLYKMAITDGLTDLITQKHFKYLLDKQADKKENKFSLIMFDIDHFKKINDTYGHQAGDAVLSNIASITKSNFRPSDVVARYGGEEFAVILPETTMVEALELAENLRKSIEEACMNYNNQILKVTISIGVSVFPADANDSESMIKCADTALYQSKRDGRNRVTVYNDTLSLV